MKNMSKKAKIRHFELTYYWITFVLGKLWLRKFPQVRFQGQRIQKCHQKQSKMKSSGVIYDFFSNWPHAIMAAKRWRGLIDILKNNYWQCLTGIKPYSIQIWRKVLFPLTSNEQIKIVIFLAQIFRNFKQKIMFLVDTAGY